MRRADVTCWSLATWEVKRGAGIIGRCNEAAYLKQAPTATPVIITVLNLRHTDKTPRTHVRSATTERAPDDCIHLATKTAD